MHHVRLPRIVAWVLYGDFSHLWYGLAGNICDLGAYADEMVLRHVGRVCIVQLICTFAHIERRVEPLLGLSCAGGRHVADLADGP